MLSSVPTLRVHAVSGGTVRSWLASTSNARSSVLPLCTLVGAVFTNAGFESAVGVVVVVGVDDIMAADVSDDTKDAAKRPSALSSLKLGERAAVDPKESFFSSVSAGWTAVGAGVGATPTGWLGSPGGDAVAPSALLSFHTGLTYTFPQHGYTRFLTLRYVHFSPYHVYAMYTFSPV